MTNLMKDLTAYAHAVDSSASIEEARQEAIKLIEQFKFNKKAEHFRKAVLAATSRERIMKMCWDIVLRGELLHVI